MNINNILKITQIVVSILLVLLILIQSKGKGLAGGIGESFSFYRSKRGVEKVVFYSTIVFSVLLAVNSILVVIIK